MGRRGRDGQPGWTGHEARWKLADRAAPHWSADKQGGTTGEQDRPCNAGFQSRQNKASELLAVKTYGGCGGRRNCQILESGARAEQATLFPL